MWDSKRLPFPSALLTLLTLLPCRFGRLCESSQRMTLGHLSVFVYFTFKSALRHKKDPTSRLPLLYSYK